MDRNRLRKIRINPERLAIGRMTSIRWLQANLIIHCVAESLFAAQVPLRCLHGDMSKQELNLLKFTAGLKKMTKTRASPA
jgi:hypothetical protein